MSQSELDEILEEIRTRGNSSNRKKATDDEVKEAMDSFSSAKKNINEPEPQSNEDPLTFIDIPAPKKEEPVEETELPADTQEEKEDATDLFALSEDEYTEEPTNYEPKKKDKKKIIIPIIAVVLVIAIVVGICFAIAGKDKPVEEPTTTTKPSTTQAVPVETGDINPLTGETGFTATGKRPIAVSVDNEFSSTGVRPQWGIDEADIVFEAESEASTRLLLFFADYSKAPAKIGPTRSARPSFIRFSQLFDSLFIHAGLSRSKGNYVGADSVFVNENIDHINLLAYSESSGYFGRDKSRSSVIEHTGYFNGTNASKMLEEAKLRTDVNDKDFAPLNFNKEAKDIGTLDGEYAYFDWSNGCGDGIEVLYVEKDGVYQSSHFDSSSSGEISNCKWTNCVFLFADTSYIVKHDYKGKGNTETYCEYDINNGGTGVVLSKGKAANIEWGVTDGKLWMKNKDTNEDIALNPGKTYIALGSANHEGSITTALEE